MTKLNSARFANDKPVKLSIELPAYVHRHRAAYAEVLGRATGQAISDRSKQRR